MARRARRVLFVGVTLLLATLIGLVLAEAAVRLLVPPAQWRWRDSTADWRPDDRLGWVQKGGLDIETRQESGWTVRFATNPDGLTPATAKREKPPGVFRILMMGDSTVVGRGVPQNQTVHAQLEAELRRRGWSVEVLNGGVEGYSTDQQLLRIESLLPLYKPDLVLLAVCENDLGGNSSRRAYGLPKPSFELDGDRLREVPPEQPWDPSVGSEGPRAWLQRSAVYRLAQPLLLAARARFADWRERNLLGLAPELYFDEEALQNADWELFEALIRKIDASVGAAGARFAFYAHPSIAEVWEPYIEETVRRLGLKPSQYDRRALEGVYSGIAERSGIDFVPLIDRFKEREGPFHLVPRDPHCNPLGYRITAEALADFVDAPQPGPAKSADSS